MQGVVRLELSGCNDFTEAGLWSSLNARITALSVSDCINVADDAIAAISQLLPNLAELNLQAYHVTDTALAYFTAKQGYTTHTLRLNSCWEITNHGVVNMVHSLPNLSVLSLSGCSKVTDDGVELVAENLRKLRSLDLSWCPRITDMALEYIACDLHKLEELVLDRYGAVPGGRGPGTRHLRVLCPHHLLVPITSLSRVPPPPCPLSPQVCADHRHRAQLPVHHVVPAEPLPALVLPGTGGRGWEPGAGDRREVALAWGWGRSSMGWASWGCWRALGRKGDVGLGTRGGVGGTCGLSGTRLHHPASAPSPTSVPPVSHQCSISPSHHPDPPRCPTALCHHPVPPP